MKTKYMNTVKKQRVLSDTNRSANTRSFRNQNYISSLESDYFGKMTSNLRKKDDNS